MIQYARLNKKKNCLAYFSFFLILKYLFNLILAKIPELGLPLYQGIWLWFLLVWAGIWPIIFSKVKFPGGRLGRGPDRGWIWLVHKMQQIYACLTKIWEYAPQKPFYFVPRVMLLLLSYGCVGFWQVLSSTSP
jgi:hypothetical protein